MSATGSLTERENEKEFACEFFLNVECLMEDNFLPEKGSRRSIIKEKVALLKEIAEASNKLKLLLVRLDDFTLDHIDSKLGDYLGVKYEQD